MKSKSGLLVSSIWIGILGGSLLLIGKGSAVETEPDYGVSCSEGDLIYEAINDVVESANGPSTAGAAISQYREDNYQKLPPGSFDKASETATKAAFKHEKGGATKMKASVERFGEGWYVTSFIACNETAKEAAGVTP